MNPKLGQALDAIHDIAVEAGISFCFVAESEGSMLVSAKVEKEPVPDPPSCLDCSPGRGRKAEPKGSNSLAGAALPSCHVQVH